MQTSPKVTPTLRDYQRQGVEELLKKLEARHGALLADAPGLGKTAQAIMVMNHLMPEETRGYPALVVCPASLKLNWRRELATWFKYEQYSSVDVYSYGEIVRGHATKAYYGIVIFDEAHYLKNPEAKRTKVCLSSLHAEYRLFLTGTPVSNRPIELYPILHSLGMKLTYRQFGFRYCGGKVIYVPVRGGHGKRQAYDFTGSSHEDELNRNLRASVMVRRTKEEVLTELPRKIRQVIAMDFKSGESKAFKDRFASLSLATDILEEAGRTPFTELAKERYNVAVAKLPYVLDFINDLLEEEEKVVVFAHHREVIEAIVNAGPNRVYLYGGMTEKQKDEAVQAFQNGSARVFVGQITASRNKELFTTTGDATGSWVHDKNLDRTGHIRIDITQISDDVITLVQLCQIFESVQSRMPGLELTINSVASGTTPMVTGRDCYISKLPDLPLGETASRLSWDFTCGQVIYEHSR
jgi:SWI/SNF-related matrix-associated actin-dependent regulator 1 of chromatin subfamily A